MKKIIIFGMCMLIMLTGCKEETPEDICHKCDDDLNNYYYDCTEWKDLSEKYEGISNPIRVKCCQYSDCVVTTEFGSGTCALHSFNGTQYNECYWFVSDSIDKALEIGKNKVYPIRLLPPNNLPKNLTCYNSTYNIYHGEFNNTCNLFACKGECEIDMIRQMEWDSPRYAYYDYIDCLEECLDKIDELRIDRYDAHRWNCIINETIEEIQEERCY
jgi:hypothetical protein